MIFANEQCFNFSIPATEQDKYMLTTKVNMYFIIYKTTNIINNKIYIGQHQTENLDDGYLGSGIYLWNSIKKYGVENFFSEILHTFDNFEDMDRKEIEIVNKNFIKRIDVMNIITGGRQFPPGFVIARFIGEEKYRRILKDDWIKNRELFESPTDGSLLILEDGQTKRILCSDYIKGFHSTPSTGKVSVRLKTDGKTMSVKLDDFDPDVHEKVFGGIVAKVNGKNQYVTREEFNVGLSGVHVGKVTAIEKSTGIKKHIPKEEFDSNRNLYLHNTEGFITGKHRITNISKQFSLGEVAAAKIEYRFTTEGERTVYDIRLSAFINILVDDYDKNFHKNAQDRKFLWYCGDVIREFWGGKKEFLETYDLPERVWTCVLSGEVFNTRRKKYRGVDGSYFKLLEWR